MKIIILSGSGGCGKDSIMSKVVKNNHNIKPIVSVTTRPMREGEVEGVNYNFITKEKALTMLKEDKFIEKRVINTIQGQWIYGVVKDSIDIKSNNTYIAILDYIGTCEMVEFLTNNGIPRDCIRTYFIQASGKTRLMRSISREQNTITESKIVEICRRLVSDSKEVEIYKQEYDYILTNETIEDLEKCIKIISNMEG